MKSAKQWVDEHTQSGAFDCVNSCADAEALVKAIQADAVPAKAPFESIPIEDYVKKRTGVDEWETMCGSEREEYYIETGRAWSLCRWLQERGYFREGCGVIPPKENKGDQP